MTVDGKVYQSTAEPGPNQYTRIPHIGRGPLNNVTGYRDPVDDLEKPHGKWNVLELIVEHDRILYFVNGRLANVGTNPNPTQGKFFFSAREQRSFSERCRSPI